MNPTVRDKSKKVNKYVIFTKEILTGPVMDLMNEVDDLLADKSNNVVVAIRSIGGNPNIMEILFSFLSERKDELSILVLGNNYSAAAMLILKCLVSGFKLEWIMDNNFLGFHKVAYEDLSTRDIGSDHYNMKEDVLKENLMEDLYLLRMCLSDDKIKAFTSGEDTYDTISNISKAINNKNNKESEEQND